MKENTTRSRTTRTSIGKVNQELTSSITLHDVLGSQIHSKEEYVYHWQGEVCLGEREREREREMVIEID